MRQPGSTLSAAVAVIVVLSVGLVVHRSSPIPAPHRTATPPPHRTDIEADVIVYGGTAGGVAAAVSAARAGADVALVSPTQSLGGMMVNGLSATDIGDRGSIGGLAIHEGN